MIEQLFGTDNFNVLPHLVALVAAYALAFPIGWNREQEERSAGNGLTAFAANVCFPPNPAARHVPAVPGSIPIGARHARPITYSRLLWR
jgi:hypothetical protein